MRKDDDKKPMIGWDESVMGPWPEFTAEQKAMLERNRLECLDRIKENDRKWRRELAEELRETGNEPIGIPQDGLLVT